jgi:hypothetical protein
MATSVIVSRRAAFSAMRRNAAVCGMAGPAALTGHHEGAASEGLPLASTGGPPADIASSMAVHRPSPQVRFCLITSQSAMRDVCLSSRPARMPRNSVYAFQAKGYVALDERDMSMANLEALKRVAAARALELVRPGMRLGLGTGSTAKHFVELLGERDVDGVGH